MNSIIKDQVLTKVENTNELKSRPKQQQQQQYEISEMSLVPYSNKNKEKSVKKEKSFAKPKLRQVQEMPETVSHHHHHRNDKIENTETNYQKQELLFEQFEKRRKNLQIISFLTFCIGFIFAYPSFYYCRRSFKEIKENNNLDTANQFLDRAFKINIGFILLSLTLNYIVIFLGLGYFNLI
jgi:hypothetical protein